MQQAHIYCDVDKRACDGANALRRQAQMILCIMRGLNKLWTLFHSSTAHALCKAKQSPALVIEAGILSFTAECLLFCLSAAAVAVYI